MKKFVIFMCIFLCMFNVVLASEVVINENSNSKNNDLIKSGEIISEASGETTIITADTFEFKTLKGEVIDVGEPYYSNNEKCQDVKVYINDKGYKATSLIAYKMSFYADTINYAKSFEKGDKVFVYTTFENGRIIGTEIAYRDNSSYLIFILILFVVSVILIGGVKGIKSLIGLILTIIAIFYILVPGIMSGKSPLQITILISIAVIFITFIIISGFNRKSYSAMIGTTGGIIFSGLFAILFGNLMNLTGMCEESGLLAGISDVAKGFDFRGILFSGIIIGALRSLYGCRDVYCFCTL